MAHFIAGCQGNRGSETRLGSKESGARAYANGWNIGARVWASYDEDTKKDGMLVELNGGSNGGIYPCGFSFDRNESAFEITSMGDDFISMVKDYFKRNNIMLD